MLPLSTHLFSHWSIPLNRGIFIDFFMYFFKYLPLSKLFAPRSKVSKICFRGLRYCLLCSNVKKQSDIKIYYFFPFHFSNKPFYSKYSCTLHLVQSANQCFFSMLYKHIKKQESTRLKADSNANAAGFRASCKTISCSR